MTAAAARFVDTSTPLRKYQWSTGVAPGRSASSTWFPASRYDVVREPGCDVTAWRTSARYIVTARFAAAGSATCTGSETTWAPAGITTEARPENVTRCDVPARLALTPARPSIGSATDTAVTVSSAPPNTLDSRSRTAAPPIDGRTVCRSVRSASGTGGMLSGSVSWGAAAQVPTHATRCNLPLKG